MKLISYKFLSADDFCDLTVKNWSRAYEYPLVLNRVREISTRADKSYSMGHNTACGGMYPVHREFIKKLMSPFHYCEFINSDTWTLEQVTRWGIDPHQINYTIYDIREQWESVKFDIVLCISTLEHLESKDVIKAFNCLYEQLNPDGRLLITYDHADIDPEIMKNLVGCYPKKVDNPLTKKTSKVRSGAGGENDTTIAYLEVRKDD